MENIEEIIKKSEWCLNCPTKPCSEKGCPMNTPIPDVIKNVKNNDYKKAYEILIENNICSHICSLVCPQELQCEGSCVRGIKQTATEIGQIEKFVNEWSEEEKVDYKFIKKEKNGKTVAVVGSGPAGIECAVELLKNGFDVTIFEKEKKLGGLLTYGIPDFRLPKNLVENIFEKIINLGAHINTNAEFGKNFDLQYLCQNFDYVFLGIGAGKSSTYKLTSENVDGIYNSDIFLKQYNENDYIKNLGDVIVIGGGNVAMDSARAAIRMGATSTKILYRRDAEHMPARKIELEEAINDGVQFISLTKVISLNNEGKKIESVNCLKTEIIDGKAVDISESDFQVKANTVVFAIGLKPYKEIFEKEGLRINENGLIDVDENGMTNIENVYAGGDLTENRPTVCKALASGKNAAKGIIKNS